MKLVLASASPRRKELLKVLGIPFTVFPASIDEAPQEGEKPDAFVVRVAREKGMEVSSRLSESVILSADTIVTIGDEILGKPLNQRHAVQMLGKLSGRRHSVLTAVCVINQRNGQTLEGSERTDVWFDPMTEDQIRDYVRREDVMDKAGSYAIQGYAGVYISRIEGNYFNVMGLPLPLVHKLLCRTLS